MSLVNHILSLVQPYQREIIAVGGCVRDMLLNIEPNDVDIASRFTPEEIKSMLPFPSYDTGIEHGTVTFIIDGNFVEHTTFRKDVDPDGRHSTVKYASNFMEDTLRRDFTINAMGFDGENILDFHGGQNDLKNKVLKTVGNPQDRFKEDYLRIIRAFRFAVKFDMTFDIELDNAITELHSNVLKYVSKERLLHELIKCIHIKKIPLQLISVIFNGKLLDNVPKLSCIDYKLIKKLHDDVIMMLILTQLTDEQLDSYPLSSKDKNGAKLLGELYKLLLSNYIDISALSLLIWKYRKFILNTHAELKTIPIFKKYIIPMLNQALKNYPPNLVGKDIGDYQLKTFHDILCKNREFLKVDRCFQIKTFFNIHN